MTIRQSAQRAKHYAYIRARAVKRSQDRAKRAIATATPGVPRSWREASLSLEALGALRHRGWQRSASGVALVDSDGTPLPWLTYPAVDFLAQMRLSRMRVLEFGAGASTPWLGRRVDYLLSVEDDAQWFGRVERPERGDLVFKACTGDWYDTELPCDGRRRVDRCGLLRAQAGTRPRNLYDAVCKGPCGSLRTVEHPRHLTQSSKRKTCGAKTNVA